MKLLIMHFHSVNRGCDVLNETKYYKPKLPAFINYERNIS